MSDKENATTPVWVQELETRLQSRKLKLGHEIGAGAPCFTCKENCPGLELHFWRKKCKNCKCGKEVHDVAEDDDIRFQILFKDKENCSKYKAARTVLQNRLHKNAVLRQFGGGDSEIVKSMSFDWVPPEASPILAADYMNELPTNKRPISGSVGAKYRKIQLKKQIPLHDLLLVENESFSEREKPEYEKYLTKLREDAGVGKILRVKQTQSVEESKPCKLQTAQTSGAMNDLNAGLKNINVQAACYNTPPAAFGLRLPSSFIPSKSILENHPVENLPFSDSRETLNNNLEPDIDKTNTSSLRPEVEESSGPVDLSKITLLQGEIHNQTPGITQTLTSTGIDTVNTRLDHPDPTVTPQKYAEKKTNFDNDPEAANNGEQNVTSSDVANANSTNTVETCAPAENQEIHLAEKNISCFDCKKVIGFNSIAVFIDKMFADKTGQTPAWHPKCFVCKECKELLVDLMYFFHKGSVYCARHYTEKLKIHRCSACDELIFVPEYTLAENQYYHLHHFCCADCDMTLADKEYVLNNLNSDLPTCLECYGKIYAKKCHTCGEPVKPGQQGICYKDFNWHATPECFKCSKAECQKSLVNKKFIIVNQKLLCSKECA